MANSQRYIQQSELADYRKANTPHKCPILGHDTIIPVVDHDHKTGRIRGVISLQSNVLLGKIENCFRSRCSVSPHVLPKVLRLLADYLERDQGPLHPIGTRQLTKRLNNMTKGEQRVLVCDVLGVSTVEFDACRNSKDRTKLYRKALVK